MSGITNRHGRTIQSLEEWRDHAGPASEKHWKDGRSAKELAKAWLQGTGSIDLIRLLDSKPETSGLVIKSAVVEAQVAFDDFPGEDPAAPDSAGHGTTVDVPAEAM